MKSFRDIDAVYEDDLDRLLARVNLLENFKDGKLKCKFCKTTVTRENVYSIIRDSDQHKLVCNKALCVSALMDYLEAKRKGKANDA